VCEPCFVLRISQASTGSLCSRFLTDEQEVWSQNAWDHVPPPDDQDEIIAKALEKQKSNPVPVEEKLKYNEKPAKHWYAPSCAPNWLRAE
jgi:hypothetical protein